MAILKPISFRSALRAQLFNNSLRRVRPQPWRRIGRRGYASGGSHEPKKAGGDLPWIIGSIAVTLPTCAYLLQPSSDKGHGHGEHEKKHVEEEETQEDGEESDEPKEGTKEENGTDEEGEESDKGDVNSEKSEGEDESQPESTDESQDEDSGTEKDSKEESGDEGEKKQGSPEIHKGDDEPHEVESGGNTEGVQFKGATSAGTNNEQGDTRKHIPDAKGGAKKRIESDYGIVQGVSDKVKDTDPTGTAEKDKATSSKPPTSQNEQSGKQEGLTNTDTKHSTDIANNPDKSTKGEGTPETSKTKGTVDVSRPQK